MEHKKLFRRFKGRLLTEGLAHAALSGLICGALAVFITSFVYHLLIRTPSAGLMVSIFAAVFCIGFLVCFILRYPTRKRIAARLDEMGLQERAGTMLAYADREGTLVHMQRKDAVRHIGEADPGQIKFRFTRRQLLTCVIAVCLAAVMLLIPYNILAPGSDMSPEEAAQAQAIAQLIDQLRQQVTKAQLPEALKEQLIQIIDQLEQALQESDSELEQAILIDQALQDMENAMQISLSRNSIGQALQRFELTKTLGQHISNGDMEAIPGTLDDLETMLSVTSMLVTKLGNNIDLALEDSGVDPSDFLYRAFSDFSEDLSYVSYTRSEQYREEVGMDPDILEDPNESGALSVAFDTAEAAILAALDEQALLEAEMSSVTSVLTEGSRELTDSGSGAQAQGSAPSGGGQGGSSEDDILTGGDAPDNSYGQVGGMGGGPSNSSRDTMLEGIYDPISGNVTYGEVFAAYYAEYLAALEEGVITEELQALFDKYFSALS